MIRPFGCSLGLTKARRTVLACCGTARKMTLMEIAAVLGHKGHGYTMGAVRWLRDHDLLDDDRRPTELGRKVLETADDKAKRHAFAEAYFRLRLYTFKEGDMAAHKITTEQMGMLRRAKTYPIICTLGSDGPEFSYADGSSAHARTVRSCIAHGLLSGRGDHLLRAGWSQQYEPSPEALRRMT